MWLVFFLSCHLNCVFWNNFGEMNLECVSLVHQVVRCEAILDVKSVYQAYQILWMMLWRVTLLFPFCERLNILVMSSIHTILFLLQKRIDLISCRLPCHLNLAASCSVVQLCCLRLKAKGKVLQPIFSYFPRATSIADF